MIDIVSLGEILIDFTPSGHNERGIPLFAQNPGGAPANVLAMAAKLGGKTAFIGKVGNDSFGNFLKHTLEVHAIGTEGLVKDPTVPTTLAFVHLNEGGDRSFTFYRKPGADTCLTAGDVNRDLLDACRIFHFGSLSLTDEPCRTATLAAVTYVRAQGKTVSFDPNYRPGLWESQQIAREQMLRCVAMADILKVSEEEMELLTGETDPQLGSDRLLAIGPRAVFVTLGAKGAYYRNRAGHGAVPTYPVKVVDTTGAGDTFMGSVLWQLMTHSLDEIATMDLRETVSFANAAGSLTTTRSGAIPAMPTYEEICQCRQKA